jgi:hypothetical protein
MKRTLKRESKVLEIVRREAIGAGGSSLVRGCSVVPACREGRSGGECSRASALCSSWRKPCIQSRRRASIGFMFICVWLTGAWGSKGLAGRLHSRVPPVRPSVPAIAGAEEPINPCPQGRGSASSWRACVWGSGTDARVHACRSVACVHLWWVSDAGGTALIDPS